MAGRDAETRIGALVEAYLPRVISQLVAGLCILRLCELGCDCGGPLVRASEFVEKDGRYCYVGAMVFGPATCPARALRLRKHVQDYIVSGEVEDGPEYLIAATTITG